nr:ATP-binding cassette domain-containing protein [Pseudonocardia sp. ICBG601]
MDIADGEFMILVGPSGCGKSTLLRMIVGLEDITSGDMIIAGNRVNDKAPRDRNLSMVFQNYALYPHLSVFENIAFRCAWPRHPRTRSGRRSTPRRRSWSCRSTSSASQRTCPAVSASGSRWAAPSSATDRRVPVRRAAVQPGREAARADAHRDRPAAAPPRHHHGLRHPRPDRGDDPRRPVLRAAQGCHPAGRLAARALRTAGQPVRRRVHRGRRR